MVGGCVWVYVFFWSSNVLSIDVYVITILLNYIRIYMKMCSAVLGYPDAVSLITLRLFFFFSIFLHFSLDGQSMWGEMKGKKITEGGWWKGKRPATCLWFCNCLTCSVGENATFNVNGNLVFSKFRHTPIS